MQIIVKDLNCLETCGVYKITNTVNGKYYIGSTKQKIRLRLNHHLQALRNRNHKNQHLQRAWNKYGEDSFVFTVLENCNKSVVYNREQFYLDNRDLSLSYNINPNATGFSENEETKAKLIESHKKFNKECTFYYQKYKSGELTIEDIPEKFRLSIIKHAQNIPWNKGKKYKSTSHLKVPHKITERTVEKCKNFSETFRENASVVYVYDGNLNFIDSFRSAIDLANLSKHLNLPIKSRFNKKRGGVELYELQSCNINKAIKTNKTYKGLYFKTVPLHQGIDDLNEPKSVKNWNVNTEVNTESKESVSPYSIETEPANAE